MRGRIARGLSASKNKRCDSGLNLSVCVILRRVPPLSFLSFSKKGEPHHRPQNTIVLIIGTPKKIPLNVGNPISEPSNFVQVARPPLSVACVRDAGCHFVVVGLSLDECCGA